MPYSVFAQTGTFYRAWNINGPALTIDARAWEASPSVSISAFCSQSVALSPVTDAARAQMIRCSAYNGSVEIPSLVNSSYHVYVFTWEDSGQQAGTLSIDGVSVVSDAGLPAGSWARRGPFTVSITDGNMLFTVGGGV